MTAIIPHKVQGLIVTDIGEYIDKGSCERNLKLRLDKGKETQLSRLRRGAQAHGPDTGDEWTGVRGPVGEGFLGDHDASGPGREQGRQGKHDLGRVRRRRQGYDARHSGLCPRGGNIPRKKSGRSLSPGGMDFVLLRWDNETPVLRIVECKASRKDKTYHRLQIAAYRLMVNESLNEGALSSADGRFDDLRLESVVARIDEASNQNQDALKLPSLDLEEEMDDLRHLLSSDGPFVRIDGTPLEELNYRLEPKCDTCLYCPVCLPESARLRRLELIGIDPSAVNILIQGGIADIDALADLDLDSETARKLRRSSGFNVDLGDLIVRARARRSTLKDHGSSDWSVMSRPNPGMGQLPAYQNGTDPRLVRIYLDVEYDYIENRLVGLAAHITDSDIPLVTRTDRIDEKNRQDPGVVEGDPKTGEYRPVSGKEVVVCIGRPWTDLTQDDERERSMLQAFFGQLADGIVEVAKNDQKRPVHFYVWSKNDMTHLIDSCTRAGDQCCTA